jgi:hypothetical protein
MGKSSAAASPRNFGFSASPISPMKSMSGSASSGSISCDLLLEVGPVHRVHLGRDAQGHARSPRGPDREIGPLLR